MRLSTRALVLISLITVPALAHAGLAPPAPAPGMDFPEPLRSLVAWAFALQRQLNGEMRQHLAAIKETGSLQPALGLMLAAFLYGVFHAIGPGHGKVIIGSWFATHRARVAHGLAACGLSALVQAGSAVAAVGLLAGALALAPKDVMAQAAWLEAGSYGLITVMGLAMGWNILRGRHSCGHAHHHHDGCCGHHHPKPETRTLFGMAAAVGFRPCSGAILVLLFTLANGIFWIGIAATLAMAVGVALTVSGIGLSALGLNRLLDRSAVHSVHAERIRKGLALAGASVITVMGAVLLLGAVQGGVALTG